MSTRDPTDHALAAIASMLDQSEPQLANDPIDDVPTVPESEIETAAQADGYSKIGPGPIEALRFRWSVRRGVGDSYFVDETIGEHSRPQSTGPMSAADAVRFVDARDRKARIGYEDIKTGMTSTMPGGTLPEDAAS